MTILLASVENPHFLFPSIHVAGTNGKGSTCSFLASIATEAGYRTGLYTSPHLVRFTERIRIDGKQIPEARLGAYVAKLRPVIEKTKATFFEATTCIAFQYFADRHVDIAVIETGLGGRLDATNVLRPLLSIITNVSSDHTEILGTRLVSIAREKGGIIKQDIPCLTASPDPEVLKTLSGIAVRQCSSLYRAEELVSLTVPSRTKGSLGITLEGKHVRVTHATLGLRGSHQFTNARLACAAYELLHRLGVRAVHRCTNPALTRGLRKVCANTGLRGRLETLNRNTSYIMDVAHNPGAIKALAAALRERVDRSFVVVFGVMKDKDYTSMIRELIPVARTFITVRPRTRRALPERTLRKELSAQNAPVRRGGSVSEGLTVARRIAGKRWKVLVTGSHYVVGEAISVLESST